MKITIHRGTHQIGGCITEIATDDVRILIDLGSNLPGVEQPDFSQSQILNLTRDVNAIFYTHYHGDHVGLMNLVPLNVPQYIGRCAKKVMQCKCNALQHIHPDTSIAINTINQNIETLTRLQHISTFVAEDEIIIYNHLHQPKIKVTPYFVSHSACDAYMFKIELEGKTILHTGDYRQHGYLGKGLLPNLAKNIKQIDILITEGTMLSRNSENIIHENNIKINTTRYLRSHKYVFALCSSTDIDRLASFYHAALTTNHKFLCDYYQKQILDIFTNEQGPHSNLYNFNSAIAIRTSNPFFSNDILHDGFIIPIRPSMVRDKLPAMLKLLPPQQTSLIYSMWQGYHNGTPQQINPDIVQIRNLFHNRIADGTHDGFHTSGHASLNTIAQVCDIVQPRLGIITIHRNSHTSLKNTPIAKKYNIIEHSTTINNIVIELF